MKKSLKIFNEETANYRIFVMRDMPPGLVEEIDRVAYQTSRRKMYIVAKQHLIKRLREQYKLSYPDIGALLLLDHSTIIMHYKRVK